MTTNAEKDAATLTDKEIELREWLRAQPGGAERWMVIKAGFRRSYDMGASDALREAEFEVRDARSIPITARAAICAVLRGRASRLARVTSPGSGRA